MLAMPYSRSKRNEGGTARGCSKGFVSDSQNICG